RPISQPAIRLCSFNTRIKLPQEFAVPRVQSKYLLRRRDSVQNAIDDDRTCLQSARFAGVETPRNRKFLHVCPVNLCQLRIVHILWRTAICRPIVFLTGGIARARATWSLVGVDKTVEPPGRYKHTRNRQSSAK